MHFIGVFLLFFPLVTSFNAFALPDTDTLSPNRMRGYRYLVQEREREESTTSKLGIRSASYPSVFVLCLMDL